MKLDILIRQRSRLVLDVARGTCEIDGYTYEAKVGNWMFFIPATGEKYLHSLDGRVDTLARGRHKAHSTGGRYSPEEWRSVLNEQAHERVAQIYVTAERLFQTGVGPRPIGLCRVDDMVRDGAALGRGFGLITEDATRLRRRLWPATRFDLRRAGVSLDRFRSSIRTQIRGYVVDLCSVDGVRPIDATAETSEIARLLLSPAGQEPKKPKRAGPSRASLPSSLKPAST